MMYESLFSASQHHILPVTLGHFIPISPAAAKKVMQELLFGAFLHHFSPIPGKRPALGFFTFFVCYSFSVSCPVLRSSSRLFTGVSALHIAVFR